MADGGAGDSPHAWVLDAVLDAAADAVVVADREGRVVAAGPRLGAMWRLGPGAATPGAAVADLLAAVAAQLAEPDRFAAWVASLAADPGASGTEVLTTADGRVVECHALARAVGGTPVGRAWVFRDVTARRRLEQAAARRALTDPVTGLVNRALFGDRLAHALARAARRGRRLAVLVVELEGLGAVNEGLGRDAGDQLLEVLAARLRSCLRASDTAGRLGGATFGAVLEGASRAAATVVARRVVTSLSAPATVGGVELAIAAVAGVAVARPGLSVDDIVMRAAEAARAARRSAGAVAVFEPALRTGAVGRLRMVAELRRAVAAGELVLHYQPVVALATGEAVGAEALLRWAHPSRGLLTPGVFWAVAEEAGLATAVAEAVLGAATAQLAAWRAALPAAGEMWVSVNLSPRQLAEADVVALATDALGRTGLEPESLVVEVTEEAVVDDLAATRCAALAAAGVGLAVDDFGTGYSSLAQLRRLPVRFLKIDRAFVAGIDAGPEDAALARAVLRLARSLRLAAVAEGVETSAQARMLRAFGCEWAQGYHLCRPLPPDELGALLAAGTVAEPVPAAG
jgi:diguanylate cyclase (GGDEF)-like protein